MSDLNTAREALEETTTAFEKLLREWMYAPFPAEAQVLGSMSPPCGPFAEASNAIVKAKANLALSAAEAPPAAPGASWTDQLQRDATYLRALGDTLRGRMLAGAYPDIAGDVDAVVERMEKFIATLNATPPSHPKDSEDRIRRLMDQYGVSYSNVLGKDDLAAEIRMIFDSTPPATSEPAGEPGRGIAPAIEAILVRRILKDRMEGYTLEASREIADKIRSFHKAAHHPSAGAPSREAIARPLFCRDDEDPAEFNALVRANVLVNDLLVAVERGEITRERVLKEFGSPATAPVGATIPNDLAKLIVSLGEAQWGATDPLSADEHADHVRESVKITAEHFNQSGPQPMNGLYLAGTETVLCHTGTGPNSGQIARALTGAWNHLVAEASRALYATPPSEGVEREDQECRAVPRLTIGDIADRLDRWAHQNEQEYPVTASVMRIDAAALRAMLGEWSCAARKQPNGPDTPADCNWPVCGCDPAANKVIEALEEAYFLPAPPAQDAEQEGGAS